MEIESVRSWAMCAAIGAAAACGTTPAALQTTNTPVDGCAIPHDSLRSVLRASHAYHGGVGQQTVIVRDGRIVFSDLLGHADLEHEVPVIADSRFFVASVTKAVTAATLLKLVESKVIDLDEPVQTYLPEFPRPPSGVVTPRLLAAHVGGVRHYRPDERTADFFARHFDDVAESLELFSAEPYAAPPDSAFLYTSYGYDLLAAAMQAADGRPFEEIVRIELLEPLGLARTSFDNVLEVLPNRVRGYTYWFPWFSFEQVPELLRAPEYDYSYNAGGGNLRSTAADLAQFGYAVAIGDFLSATSRALLHAPVSPATAWGLGWRVSTDGGGRLRLRSEGSDPGFQASIDVYPEEGAVIAVVLNSWGRRPEAPPPVEDAPGTVMALCMGW